VVAQTGQALVPAFARLSLLAGASVGVLVALAGCGSLKPPESCPFGSGAADPAAFAATFSDMTVRTAAGSPGIPGNDSELVFKKGEALELAASGIRSTTAQVCLVERKGGGKIVLSTSIAIRDGDVRVLFGDLPPNPYVARVAVDGQIVRNVTFQVE